MYTFSAGTRRYVLAIPLLGIVLKFPRIYLHNHAWALLKYAVANHFAQTRRTSLGTFLYRELFEYTTEHSSSMKNYLLGGLVDNWGEFFYYRQSVDAQRKLLQPTYFSLLGLVNVQKYGAPIPDRTIEEGPWLWMTFYKIVGQTLIHDGHHWQDPRNFHIENGQLKILDYGSKKTQAILDSFAKEIHEKFTLPNGN